jgi:hypothetical protein
LRQQETVARLKMQRTGEAVDRKEAGTFHQRIELQARRRRK